VDPVFHDELKAPCHMIEILEADPNKTAQWNFVNSVIFCLTIVTTIGKKGCETQISKILPRIVTF